MKKVLIILFIVLFLGGLGFFLYERINFSVEEIEAEEDVKQLPAIKESIKRKVSKKDWNYESLCLDENNNKVYGEVSISIPQFRLDTEVTRQINSEIMSLYQYEIGIVNGEQSDENFIGISYSDTVSYMFNENENYVWLLIKKEYGSPCVSTTITYNSYLYDIKNDKNILFLDILDMFELSSLDIANKFIALNQLSNREIQILIEDLAEGKNFSFYKEDNKLVLYYNRFNTPSIDLEI